MQSCSFASQSRASQLQLLILPPSSALLVPICLCRGLSGNRFTSWGNGTACPISSVGLSTLSCDGNAFACVSPCLASFNFSSGGTPASGSVGSCGVSCVAPPTPPLSPPSPPSPPFYPPPQPPPSPPFPPSYSSPPMPPAPCVVGVNCPSSSTATETSNSTYAALFASVIGGTCSLVGIFYKLWNARRRRKVDPITQSGGKVAEAASKAVSLKFLLDFYREHVASRPDADKITTGAIHSPTQAPVHSRAQGWLPAHSGRPYLFRRSGGPHAGACCYCLSRVLPARSGPAAPRLFWD